MYKGIDVSTWQGNIDWSKIKNVRTNLTKSLWIIFTSIIERAAAPIKIEAVLYLYTLLILGCFNYVLRFDY